jgi:hypothetical protein
VRAARAISSSIGGGARRILPVVEADDRREALIGIDATDLDALGMGEDAAEDLVGDDERAAVAPLLAERAHQGCRSG